MKKAEYRMNLDSGTLSKVLGFEEFAMQGYYSDAQHICLINGPFNDGRFKLYQNGELSDVYKHFPQILQIKGDTAFLNQGYQNVSALSPDGTKFANIFYNSEIIEGYHLENGKIKQRWAHEWSMKPFSEKSVGGATFVAHSEDAFGFKSISVTNHYIYCVYSDKTIKESKPNTASGNYLFVFNWNGVLKKTFLLNYAIRNSAVSTDDKYLYGTAVLDNDVKMLQYKME
jgi:hypothetical protein